MGSRTLQQRRRGPAAAAANLELFLGPNTRSRHQSLIKAAHVHHLGHTITPSTTFTSY